MKGLVRRKYKQKHLFKSKEYCVNCQQRKSCGVLDEAKKYCCACYQKILEELEQEGLLISSAQLVLNDYREGVIKCYCQEAEKPRVNYLNSDGSGWSRCEKCEKIIRSAGHHRVVKNRNDVRFWGLNIEERVLCLNCLQKFQEKMPVSKRYTLNKYLKRGY